MVRVLPRVLLVLALGACSGDDASVGGGDAAPPGADGSIPAGAIGEWTDAPGACPAGVTQVDITSATELAAAARGEAPYDTDPPSTCYLIHDGDYPTTGVVFYVLVGGTDGAPRRFIGQSRAGVVIHGRGNIESASNVTISNLTFDLTGYAGSGAFNTLTLGTGHDLVVDHVTFTGDCATGASGGHVEVDGTQGALVEACLIEKFGHCGPDGHLDHGVYLANGKDIVLRNNVIRGNASRGIQMNTEGGAFGTLDGVTVDHNRIYDNGHADYEDGIVVNSTGTGAISRVVIERNLIYRNYYSGIRLVGAAESALAIRHNTFDHNGAGSSAAGRSEVNLDDTGSGNDVTVTRNLFDVGNTLLNDCYDAAPRGFSIDDNFVHGYIGTGACLGTQMQGDPQFADAATADYHPTAAAAQAYGAYAP